MSQAHVKKVVVAEFAEDDRKAKTLEENGCKPVKSLSAYTGEDFTYCFSTELMAISDIDIDSSRNMQVRMGATKINEDTVSRYVIGVEKGDQFPAIALFRRGGRWVIGDGQHTLEAYKRQGFTHIRGVYLYAHPDAYMVATMFNCKGSFEEKQDALIEKAGICYLNQKREAERNGTSYHSQVDVAKKFRVTQSQINRYLQTVSVQELLAENGIKLTAIKDKGTYHLLHSVMKKDEDACLEIAKMVSDFKLPLERVERIVKDWKSPSKKSVDKADYLNKQRQSLKVQTNNGTSTIGKKAKKTPEQVFKDYVTGVYARSLSVDKRKLLDMMEDPTFSEPVDEVIKYLKSLKK